MVTSLGLITEATSTRRRSPGYVPPRQQLPVRVVSILPPDRREIEVPGP